MSDAERAEGEAILVEEPQMARALAPVHDGLLLLGIARENLLTPRKRPTLMNNFRKVGRYPRPSPVLLPSFSPTASTQ